VPDSRTEEGSVSEFVEPTDKERVAALHGLTDAALVGHYWRLDDLDGLTDHERRRLKKYRHETFGFEEYCEGLVARGERGPDDVANLRAVLDRWEGAFCGLRFWHHDRSIFACDRNPVAKVLIYEESRITGVRGRLGPGVAVARQRLSVPAARVKSSSKGLADDIGIDHRGVDHGVIDHGGADLGGVDVTDLTDAILALAEAINRLADVISRGSEPRTARVPRPDRAARLSPRAQHAK
jgi:hypothetical protein